MTLSAILLLNAVILLVLCGLLPAVGSAVGGWRALATRFAASRPLPPGASWFVSARFGPINYLGSVAVASLPEGLYLARLPLFRLLHPPLVVPWSELRGTGDAGQPRSSVLLRVDAPQVSLVVPSRFVTLDEDGRVGPRGTPARVGLGWLPGAIGVILVVAALLGLQTVVGVLPPRDPVVTWTEPSANQPFELSWSSSAEDDYSLWLDFAISWRGPGWTLQTRAFPMVNGAPGQGSELVLNRQLKLSAEDVAAGARIDEAGEQSGGTTRGRVRLATITSGGVADAMGFVGRISGDRNITFEYLRLEVLDD